MAFLVHLEPSACWGDGGSQVFCWGSGIWATCTASGLSPEWDAGGRVGFQSTGSALVEVRRAGGPRMDMSGVSTSPCPTLDWRFSSDHGLALWKSFLLARLCFPPLNRGCHRLCVPSISNPPWCCSVLEAIDLVKGMEGTEVWSIRVYSV